MSINFPAIHGTVKALIPKHWEYKAMAEPWYFAGEDFIIAADAEGKNMIFFIHKIDKLYNRSDILFLIKLKNFRW